MKSLSEVPERKRPLTHQEQKTPGEWLDIQENTGNSPSCVLPTVPKVPKNHVSLPELVWLLAAARRALPHVSVPCTSEGVVHVKHRVGGASSSTANSFSSTPLSSCSPFRSNYNSTVFSCSFLGFSALFPFMSLLFSMYL